MWAHHFLTATILNFGLFNFFFFFLFCWIHNFHLIGASMDQGAPGDGTTFLNGQPTCTEWEAANGIGKDLIGKIWNEKGGVTWRNPAQCLRSTEERHVLERDWRKLPIGWRKQAPRHCQCPSAVFISGAHHEGKKRVATLLPNIPHNYSRKNN